MPRKHTQPPPPSTHQIQNRIHKIKVSVEVSIGDFGKERESERERERERERESRMDLVVFESIWMCQVQKSLSVIEKVEKELQMVVCI